MGIVHIDKENFEQEVLKSDRPVLVDFWAAWCGPCQMLGPIVEGLADEMPEWKICKVDIDHAPDLALQYKVMSIPTLMIFKDGEAVKTSVGVIPKSEIVDMMNA